MNGGMGCATCFIQYGLKIGRVGRVITSSLFMRSEVPRLSNKEVVCKLSHDAPNVYNLSKNLENRFEICILKLHFEGLRFNIIASNFRKC